MNAEQILTDLSAHSDFLRNLLMRATQDVNSLTRRLEQIVQQLRKNIEVRDNTFADDFNAFCQHLRKQLDQWEPQWTLTRNSAREIKPAQWAEDLALNAKGFNSQARALSKACDEFTTANSSFLRIYKSFTAAKLNVFLLNSCQTDVENLTAKILFIAREIAKYTEKNRGSYVRG